MKKKIVTDNEIREELCEAFNCSKRSVEMAMSFSSNSELSLRLRKAAMEKGAVLCGVHWYTEFKTAERLMVQRLAGMVRLEVSFDGWWKLWINDKVRTEGVGDLSLVNLEKLQHIAVIAVATQGW